MLRKSLVVTIEPAARLIALEYHQAQRQSIRLCKATNRLLFAKAATTYLQTTIRKIKPDRHAETIHGQLQVCAAFIYQSADADRYLKAEQIVSGVSPLWLIIRDQPPVSKDLREWSPSKLIVLSHLAQLILADAMSASTPWLETFACANTDSATLCSIR